MRLIDADALIEKCGGWYVDECTESGFIGTLENLLATEPTIQPQSTTGQLNDGAQSTARSTDLIERQAAIDALDCINGTEEVLRSLPLAQHERKRGEWLADNRPGGGFWVCSCCKFPSEAFAANVIYKFCPNCGAEMDDLISRQQAIEALKICDNNEDGISCYKCPLRDERWDGAWQDDETSCYRKLMRDSAELLSAQPNLQPTCNRRHQPSGGD